ncbi:MAG: SRPBCC family protein [Bacteroidia bacterium]|nr:SRPBCC family protein [Bacteroidia bacterium]
MVDVFTEIKIDRPLEEVASYASNPENAPEWYVNIKSAEWKSAPEIKLGAQIAFIAHFLGRKLSYVYEIVELVPNEKMVMRTADGPFPMETTYEWEALDENHTRMSLRNRGKPSGFSKLFAPMMAKSMRKANEKDLRMIKKILEEKEKNK